MLGLYSPMYLIWSPWHLALITLSLAPGTLTIHPKNDSQNFLLITCDHVCKIWPCSARLLWRIGWGDSCFIIAPINDSYLGVESDTSCILAWLIEQGYEVYAFMADVGQEEVCLSVLESIISYLIRSSSSRILRRPGKKPSQLVRRSFS